MIKTIIYQFTSNSEEILSAGQVINTLSFTSHREKDFITIPFSPGYRINESGNLSITYNIPDEPKPYVKKTFVFKPILFSIKQISPKYFSNIIDMRDFDDKLSIQIAFATTDQVLSISNLSVITTDEP